MKVLMIRKMAAGVAVTRVSTALFLSLLVWSGDPRRAQAGINTWTTGGPEAGVVRAIAVDPVSPSTLYAAAGSAGFFKSTDRGVTWSPVNTGLTEWIVPDLAIDPSTVYAATYGSGVFRSTDGGGNWSAIGPPVPGPYVQIVTVDPAAPAILYAALRAIARAERRRPPGDGPQAADVRHQPR